MSFAVTHLIGFGGKRAAAVGGNDSYTELLLHCDGTDASTTFTDSSSNARSVTAVGNAQIDTSDSKFGGAAGLFDGTGDYLQLSNHADWDITGDFTIDMWVKTDTLSGTMGLIGHGGYGSGSGGWDLRLVNQTLVFNCYETTGLVRDGIVTGNVITSTSAWYHVAAVRNGSSVVIYVDGVAAVTDASFATILANTNTLEVAAFRHSANSGNPGFVFDGWIDELRLSKGIARWTSDFTPPSAAYS